MATDAPVWEQYKENAAPLERGRNVDTLEMNLRVETEEERQAKENSLRHYESLVRPSEEMATNGEEMGEDDDPLIHWLSYIKFHQDYFPSDKQSQFLLMERCARTLIGQKKYANDIRFVRVCLMYADQTSDPGEIFRYLYSQKVGSTTALFWVAWAFCCEKQGDFKMAEKIFRKGKSKKAHPLSLLESRHKQFERRMARYWMNAQEQGTEEDEDEEQQGGRGVLGPLTEDSFRRNDRASARNMQNTTRARPQQGFPSTNMNTFIDRSAPTAPGGRQLFVDRHNQSRSNNKGTSSHAAGFQIYVEGDQENEDCILDRPGTINARRELPREQDRRKENTLAAERWNERGGLQNTQHYATATVAPPPPSVAAPIQPAQKPMAFPVYVDEDCAAQHQREALLQEAEQERRRRHRDERTFRPLAVGDSVAEQLYQDPLRYVKDPSQIQGDQERAKHVYSDREDDNDTENAVASTSRPTNTYMKLPSGHQEEEKKNSTHQPHSKKNSRATACGFDKSLVSKDDTGQEQCFEEQRANRNYFKTVSSNANFNYLHQPVQGDRSKLMDDSGMEIDDTTTVGDLSMEDAKVNDSVASSQKQSSRRVLFRNDTSFQEPEVSMNNVSQCSSTINSAHAVGVDNPEEETINTKLAFKELSMMFSSPAMGLSSTKNEAKRQKMGEPEIVPGLRHQQQSSFESQQRTSSFVQENRGDGEETADTAAFATIMDLVDSAGRGEEPDNSILRGGGLQADPENVGPRNPLSRANSPQELIDKHALRTLRSDTQAEASLPACQPGSIAPRRVLGQIDQDDPLAQAPANELHNNPGFVIFEDGEEDAESSGVTSTFTKEETMPFSSFRDKEVSKVRKTPSDFQIFEDKESSGEKKASSGFQIFEDKKPSANEGFQIFEDKKESSGFKIHEDCRDQESPRAASDGGDTATLSLMGDLNSILKEGDDSSVGGDQVRIKRTSNKGGTINSAAAAKGSVITDPHSFGDISVILKDPNREMIAIASPTMTMNLNIQDAVDYNKLFKSNTQAARDRLKQLASQRVEQATSLNKILSVKTLVYDEPRYILPKVFRKKLLDQGSEIKIGHCSATVKQELGRGTYGVVVLLNVDSDAADKIAVKAQTCTESLAWEYEILQKIEDRVGNRFPYPKPLAFTSLADGALMSMSAASESGLNLVDVVNMYKAKLGENVPELLAIHYTARMLNHLEMLHWHGKILHCDVKPDNWVLCSSSGVAASELMLVDFGRSVDLQAIEQNGVDAMDIQLLGVCAEKDMQCIAMRKQRPWSFDADTFGVCASTHVLLFGTHIEIEQIRGSKRWKLKQRMRRYWQGDLWTELFDALLNSDEGALIGSRPLSLKAMRNKLEAHLYSQRKQLEDILNRQARMLPMSRLHLNPTGKRL